MDRIRWQKISEALAHQEHDADIAANKARWETRGIPQPPEPRSVR